MQAVRQYETGPGDAPPGFPSLRHVIREIRRRHGWTLRELSACSGIPVSTLAKVEAGRLTLSYERLVHLAERTGLSPHEFLSMGVPTRVVQGSRRSTQRWDQAIGAMTAPASAYQMCADLLGKKMDPALIRLSVHGRAQLEGKPGDGEAYYFVVSGCVQTKTEFYRPETLSTGDSIYLDMLMRHSFSLAPGCDEAFIVRICSEPAKS